MKRRSATRHSSQAHGRMTVDTVFDLASLTKPMATATALMLLVETGESQAR